jgi:hypothetical protein
MGTTGSESLKIEPVGFNHIIGVKGAVSIETPLDKLNLQPFCPVCKAWGGLRTSAELQVTKGARVDALRARAPGISPISMTIYSERLADTVCRLEPRFRSMFRSATDRAGVVWQELLAPAEALFCGVRGAEAPYASRCGRCGCLGAYIIGKNYTGASQAIPEGDVPRDTLFYSARSFSLNPPDLVATGEGVKLLKSQGCLFDAVKVAILKAADVDRTPNVKIFNEPV